MTRVRGSAGGLRRSGSAGGGGRSREPPAAASLAGIAQGGGSRNDHHAARTLLNGSWEQQRAWPRLPVVQDVTGQEERRSRAARQRCARQASQAARRDRQATWAHAPGHLRQVGGKAERAFSSHGTEAERTAREQSLGCRDPLPQAVKAKGWETTHRRHLAPQLENPGAGRRLTGANAESGSKGGSSTAQPTCSRKICTREPHTCLGPSG